MFLDALLKPMINNKRAAEYMGRVLFEAYYEEHQQEHPNFASAQRWVELPSGTKARWYRIGAAAIKAVAHMVSQAIAGQG